MKLKKIIFDTDIGGDSDDAGALAILHELCNIGEAELLATTACFSSPYVAGCLDAVNRYYGRRVPVGMLYSAEPPEEERYAKALATEFENDYSPSDYYSGKKAPDSVKLIRKILAEAEDGEVTLVIVGTLKTAAELLESPPDEASELSGGELIRWKISRTVIMGGRFFDTWQEPIYLGGGELFSEWNIKCGIEAAKKVTRGWPSPLVFSSYEIGVEVISMRGCDLWLPESSPIRRAYGIATSFRGRMSWDQTAVLEAVRPGAYFDYRGEGKITVADDGRVDFSECRGMHTYLLPKASAAELSDIIDTLTGKRI